MTTSIRRRALLLLVALSIVLTAGSSYSNGFLMSSFRGFGAGGGGGAPYVNSVQQATCTIASSATSGTATITSVDTSKTFLSWQGVTYAANDPAADTAAASVTLTNATTITCTRQTSSSSAVTVNVTAIEGTSSLIDTIQYGTVSITAGTSGTATITSVDTTRSAVFWLGATTTSTQTSALATRGASTAVLTNATTVTATTTGTLTTATSFVVVQFKDPAVDSVQSFTQTASNGSTTNGNTITSVTTTRSMLAYGGNDGDSGQARLTHGTVQITSATNVDMVNGEAINTLARRDAYTVVEFASGVLNSNVQRGTISLASATSNTATISSVTTNKTLLTFLGQRSTGSGTANVDEQWMKVTLTNGTTVTGTINTSAARTQNVAYEVTEFQ